MQRSLESAKALILNRTAIDTNECWIWDGKPLRNGYGQAWDGRSSTTAHRVSYQAFVGDIPDGYQIDHLCRNKLCVNPNHLEAVTAKENVNRSDAHYKKLKAKTHCPQGHEYSADNTYVRKTIWGTSRNCASCMRERSKKRYWERKLPEGVNA